jgi:tight adherence protein B
VSALIAAVVFGAAGAVVTWGVLRASRQRAVIRRSRQQVGLQAAPGPPQHVRSLRSRGESLPWRKRAIRRRHEAIARDLGPTLMLVIGQLQVGRGVLAAIAEVASSTPAPLGEILTDAISEARLGTPIEEVFSVMATRENEPHLEILASALGLHARHGGSIVEIMQILVETIDEEESLQRDIRSLTADGRLSARVLLAMPPVSLGLISLMSPGYAAPLITEPLGRALTVLALCLGLFGWRWLTYLSRAQVQL